MLLLPLRDIINIEHVTTVTHHQLQLLDRRGFFASLSNADEDCGQTHLVLSLVSSESSKCSKVAILQLGQLSVNPPRLLLEVGGTST